MAIKPTPISHERLARLETQSCTCIENLQRLCHGLQKLSIDIENGAVLEPPKKAQKKSVTTINGRKRAAS